MDIYQLFVDFKQAYDSINREKFYTIMLDFNISYADDVNILGTSLGGCGPGVLLDKEQR